MARLGLRVGEVARRTGLTIRTLHPYDEIGLLHPSAQTEAGHRLYTDADLAKLQQVQSLRQLQLSLEEIRRLLASGGEALATTLARHLESTRERLDATRELCTRLERLLASLTAGRPPSLEELFATLQETVMHEKYFTPEQVTQLKQRAKSARAPAVAAAEWRQLAAEVRTQYELGTLANSSAMQGLARRWKALVEEITGGDDGIRASLVAMHRADPSVTSSFFGPTIDEPVLKYVGQALAALE